MKLTTRIGEERPRHMEVLADPTMELADRLAAAIKERMSPPGALGLPPLLEARRLRYGIPDEAFDAEPVFDRFLAWQIEPKHEEGKKTFGDTMIIKPESQQKRALKESTRVVIVSAGLETMEVFASHGIAIGSIVNIIRMSPWHVLIGNYMGVDTHLMVLRTGDVVSSEDQRELLKAGKVKKTVRDGKGYFTDEDGNELEAKRVFLDEAY